jgi:flagellar hook-basal body complex protein FliE
MVSRIGDFANIAPAASMGGSAAAGGGNFAEFMQDAGASAIESLQRGEEMSKQGIAGTAELADVVAAVNDAEMTLKTVTTLRDKMVAAYQEIARMPI